MSTVVALAAAYAALLVAFARGGPQTVSFTPLDLLVMVAILGVALIAHEGIHGLVISTYGGRPRFGWAFVARALPYRALREPPGTLIEDVADGILIHPPPIMA